MAKDAIIPVVIVGLVAVVLASERLGVLPPLQGQGSEAQMCFCHPYTGVCTDEKGAPCQTTGQNTSLSSPSVASVSVTTATQDPSPPQDQVGELTPVSSWCPQQLRCDDDWDCPASPRCETGAQEQCLISGCALGCCIEKLSESQCRACTDKPALWQPVCGNGVVEPPEQCDEQEAPTAANTPLNSWNALASLFLAQIAQEQKGEADLEISLSQPFPSKVSPGQRVTVIANIINRGPDTSLGVRIDATIPDHTQFSRIDTDSSCSFNGETISCFRPRITPITTERWNGDLRFGFRVDEDAPCGTELRIRIAVTQSLEDRYPRSNLIGARTEVRCTQSSSASFESVEEELSASLASKEASSSKPASESPRVEASSVSSVELVFPERSCAEGESCRSCRCVSESVVQQVASCRRSCDEDERTIDSTEGIVPPGCRVLEVCQASIIRLCCTFVTADATPASQASLPPAVTPVRPPVGPPRECRSDECGRAGASFCAKQHARCEEIVGLPCIRCVPVSQQEEQERGPVGGVCMEQACEQGGREHCISKGGSCELRDDFPCIRCVGGGWGQ